MPNKCLSGHKTLKVYYVVGRFNDGTKDKEREDCGDGRAAPEGHELPSAMTGGFMQAWLSINPTPAGLLQAQLKY